MFKQNRQCGFSLIELLVSIVVFSVGLLAVAGLQTVSKSANFESVQRTTASHIANGLLEDMRTNGNGIDIYLASADLGDNVIVAEPVPNCATMGATCTIYNRIKPLFVIGFSNVDIREMDDFHNSSFFSFVRIA